MPNNPDDTGNLRGRASMRFRAGATIDAYQFIGLLRLVEYNAAQAARTRGDWLPVAYSQATILAAYAALEALAQETAAVLYLPLYQDWHGFRKLGIEKKFARFLLEDQRPGEPVPAIVAEIADARIALTHSEPSNDRTRNVSALLTPAAAAQFAAGVRSTAAWLWNGRRPHPVAGEFDDPHPYIDQA